MHKHIALISGLALLLTLGSLGWAEPQDRREQSADAKAEQKDDTPPRRPRVRIDADDVDEALIVLQDYRPELAEKIKQWRSENPETVAALITEHMPWIHRQLESRRRDPEGYRLRLQDMRYEQQSQALAKEILAARRKSEDASVKEAELRKIIAEHFEARQQLRQHALANLEKTIEELRSQLAERKKSRDDVIDGRFKRLVPQPGEERPRIEW